MKKWNSKKILFRFVHSQIILFARYYRHWGIMMYTHETTVSRRACHRICICILYIFFPLYFKETCMKKKYNKWTQKRNEVWISKCGVENSRETESHRKRKMFNAAKRDTIDIQYMFIRMCASSVVLDCRIQYVDEWVMCMRNELTKSNEKFVQTRTVSSFTVRCSDFAYTISVLCESFLEEKKFFFFFLFNICNKKCNFSQILI